MSRAKNTPKRTAQSNSSNALTPNEFGFDVASDNPFAIFPHLQKLARKNLKAEDIFDLSRGDPGLGYAPAKASREFFGFLAIIDTTLNSNETGYRIHNAHETDLSSVLQMIEKTARANFKTAIAQNHLKTLDTVTKTLIKLAKSEGKKLSKLQILKGIFAYSTLLGGTYHLQQGEKLVRMAVAETHRDALRDRSIHSKDVIFTLGVNDAIGTLFKMLGTEGLGFLAPGDVVAASSPGYSPYFNEMLARKLEIVELPIAAKATSDFTDAAKSSKKIKAFFLISPNNPSGITYSRDAIQRLAEIAQMHDALIIVDEIYAPLFDTFSSIWNFAKKRTIRLSGVSKIERSPGLRFGNILVTDATNDYLSAHLLKSYLTAPDFRAQLMSAKGPGGMHGSFQHTAAVPGPSQILGMLHILLGKKERAAYRAMIRKNMGVFFKELGIPYEGEMYYGLFDLNRVPGSRAQKIPINRKLYELATKQGIVLIPALKFFSAAAQKVEDKSNFVRVSLPNLPPSRVKEAARKIREYLENPGK